MGKSLTETAKAILMKEEGAYPSVNPMGAGSPERDINTMTPAKSSLRPNAGYADGQIVNPGASSTTGNQAQDLGPALVNNTDVPPSAKAAGTSKKDSSASSQSRKGTVAAETSKKQMEVMEEDIELEEDEHLYEKTIASKKAKKGTKYKVQAKDSDDEGSSVTMRQGKRVKDTGDYDRGARAFFMKKGTYDSAKDMLDTVKEDFELSEELEEFIDQCIAEGMSEDEITQAIDENFEILEEDAEDDVELSEELESFIDQCIAEGMTEDQIAQAIDENFDLSEEAEDYEVDMQEDIEALFAGEELSEEFKQKAKTIFESAVKRKLEEELAVIEEAYANTLEEQIFGIQEELSTNVDDYLNYVVENWMSENEVAIEAGLRTELTEDFISNLKALFEEHYIDIPEEKVSVVEELGGKVEELEAKLNEEIETNIQLNKMLSESRRVEVLNQMVEGLTDTQTDKLITLAEGVSFNNIEEYAEKIATLRESYFPSSGVNAPRELDSIEAGTEGKTMIAEELNGPMAHYVRALGKTLPK